MLYGVAVMRNSLIVDRFLRFNGSKSGVSDLQDHEVTNLDFPNRKAGTPSQTLESFHNIVVTWPTTAS